MNIWATAWQKNKMICAPSEDSDQPGHPPSLIRVFAVRSIGSWGPNVSSCGQPRLIRLCGRPGWSESSLGDHAILLVLSWGGSFTLVTAFPQANVIVCATLHIWAESSEFVSSSIPSWQILIAHAQPFRGARDLAFCLKVPLDSLFVWASSGGSGETARMRRLAWTFAARIGDK